MDIRKYIFENGVMKLNPAYKAAQVNQPPTTVAAPDKALAIVSSTDDIAQATDAHVQETGKPMQLADATTSSMEIIQDVGFLDQFQTVKPLDGGQILDGLSDIFAKYEVPIGLVNKLLALSQYKLNFIIDDSSSMSNASDVAVSQASQHLQQKKGYGSGHLTRWEEAEDRLHVMMDILSFIPTESITLTFLNRQDNILLEHKGKTPEQFAQYAHEKVNAAFHRGPNGRTPIGKKLAESLNQASDSTMHYLFTDGVPTDVTTEQLKSLVEKRKNPQLNPLTFMSCTNEDSEVEWMKEIEEAGPFMAELDDFEDERREVLKDQGPGFPYTRGFWLLCQLVAAINPHDLDALDESIPFSKQTMDNLLGRKLTAEEYQSYFKNNPNAYKYNHLYNQFAREDILAVDILHTNSSGYSSAQPNANFNPGFWHNNQQSQSPTAQNQSYQPTKSHF